MKRLASYGAVAETEYNVMATHPADQPSSKDIIQECEDVIHTYQGPLLGYAGKLLQDPVAAQDAVQEAFVRYIRYRMRNGQAIQKAGSWLYRVTYNIVMDAMRKQQRWYNVQKHVAEGKEEANDGSIPEDNIIKKEVNYIAWELLNELSEREQQIVILKVIERKSYRDIAEIMEISVGNVGFILHTAMKKLSKRMKQRLNSYDEA
ncbi:MAG: sigma-70 family RNA polymerase sigma factor [Lentisphaerae bacterium]|nr:MAG: sigma-70 family RNA polymerase sigma factor [Lentisphaerota bacterium]